MTGSPFIASKISSKSSRCIGSIFASQGARSASLSASTAQRTASSRASAKNMCSVRQSPMPSAPKLRAVRAAEGAEDITFRAVVTTDDGQKTPVTFQMHVVDDEWKIYDGSVGNLSFVTNYRGQFNSQIRNGGLEKLIERMESRYNSNG